MAGLVNMPLLWRLRASWAAQSNSAVGTASEQTENFNVEVGADFPRYSFEQPNEAVHSCCDR